MSLLHHSQATEVAQSEKKKAFLGVEAVCSYSMRKNIRTATKTDAT